jgi:hypothetical protein
MISPSVLSPFSSMPPPPADALKYRQDNALKLLNLYGNVRKCGAEDAAPGDARVDVF